MTLIQELFDNVRHEPPITRQEFDAAIAELRALEREATVDQIEAAALAADHWALDDGSQAIPQATLASILEAAR